MARNASKLNMSAMKAAAKQLGFKLPKGDPKTSAEALREFFTTNHEEDALAACGVCGWESTDDFANCPYCGTELGDPEEAAAPPKEKKPKAKGKAKGKGKGKPAKKKGSKKLAKPDPKKIAECDERIAAINGYRRNLAEEAVKIGKEIKIIHDKNLWKAKGYKSFAAFCKADLDYTRVMAYKYMAMSSELKEEDAITLGVSKADVVINAAPKHKETLLKMGREGKTRAEMDAYLKKAEGKTTPPKDESKITLIGRVNLGETLCLWLSDKSGKATRRDTKAKHVEFGIVSDYKLIVREDDSQTGLLFSLEKEEDESKAA